MVKKAKTLKQQVLEFVNVHKGEGKTKKELALLMGMEYKNFRQHYNVLLKEGKVEKIDDQTKLTPKVLKELEELFSYWLTDKQACFRVNIHVNTLYHYCRENPSWAERREILKDDVIVHSKIFVWKKVKENDEKFNEMVYKQNAQLERAEVKVQVHSQGSEKVEEEVNSKNVSLKISFKN